eukprot:scaffold129010_cov69-Phaeocystis_antarctica.AAC.2
MDSLPDECVYSACICCYTCARAPRSHCAAWLGLSGMVRFICPACRAQRASRSPSSGARASRTACSARRRGGWHK